MKEYRKGLQTIATHYGAHHQIGKAAEELAEACEACLEYHSVLTRENFEHLAEELADAQIMIDQLRMIVPNLAETMEVYKAFKIKRQLERIEREKEKEKEW